MRWDDTQSDTPFSFHWIQENGDSILIDGEAPYDNYHAIVHEGEGIEINVSYPVDLGERGYLKISGEDLDLNDDFSIYDKRSGGILEPINSGEAAIFSFDAGQWNQDWFHFTFRRDESIENPKAINFELFYDKDLASPANQSFSLTLKDSNDRIYLEEDIAELGREGQPAISKNGHYLAIGLDNAILVKDIRDNSSKVIELDRATPYGNYQIEAITNEADKIYLRTWNSFSPSVNGNDSDNNTGSGGSGLYEITVSESNSIDRAQRLDVDQNGETFTYQGWSPEHGDFDLSGDEKSIVFAIRDTADSVTWGDQQVKVYKKDLSSGEILRIDQSTFSDSLGYSSRPRINYDGSKVLFESSLDLTGELGIIDSSQGNNIYLWDESYGLSLVYRTPEGSIIDSQYGWHANFDQEGRQVVFQTGKALATEDINSISDVYLKNLGSGAIDLISNQTVLKQEPGGEFDSQVGGIYPQISPGGKYVYYQRYDYNSEGSYLFAYDIESGLTSEIPGVAHKNSEYHTSESIEALSSEGALLWTWRDYAASDNDGDADYYFIRHVNDGFDWTPDSLGISYQLNHASSEAALSQLAVLGDSVSEGSIFQLSVFAESFLADHLIESTDLTIDFDPELFGEINASDITIGGSLPIVNAVQIDNEAGTIRIAAASLADLNQGSSISANTPLASINLDFDEEQIKLLEKNEDGSLKINPLSFQITANDQETVFSKTFTDDSGLTNREIVSLADLGGGIEVTGQDVTLYEAKVNLAQQGDGLVLGTQRVIGSDASTTNLVRSGDTLTTSAEWLNVGNIQANNLSYESLYNQNASLVSADFSKSSIASGSFIDGVFVKDARESTVLTTDIKITGEAGNVVDLSDGIVSVKADAEGSDSFSNAGKGSSNLITFQGDLNYDGRVSMKDLAYLNAGAARQQLVDGTDENGNAVQVASEASYARDVDADFSGKIDLADLSVLDADWGKTLHTGDEQFQGSADVSWSELDSQGTSSTWENDSFKDQNAIEAEDSYVGSLESPAAAGVIGADGNTTANDNDITGTEFQDQIPA
ncbi:hypothetical protein [Synechococcus sp. YX-04-1]|uniref:hypothetical protein n=1 Tax=Synechococcus sp. YX-04-1 TaxID=3062778 RepID=UPI0026E157EB|nr:hypothetical protein [Synechococcus sp. YX-04-1]